MTHLIFSILRKFLAHRVRCGAPLVTVGRQTQNIEKINAKYGMAAGMRPMLKIWKRACTVQEDENPVTTMSGCGSTHLRVRVSGRIAWQKHNANRKGPAHSTGVHKLRHNLWQGVKNPSPIQHKVTVVSLHSSVQRQLNSTREVVSRSGATSRVLLGRNTLPTRQQRPTAKTGPHASQHT